MIYDEIYTDYKDIMILCGRTMFFQSNACYACFQFVMVASDIINTIYQTIKQRPVPLM